MKRTSALLIAVTAMMIAVTAVFTLLVRIPIPATEGYFNFSDVAISFVGYAFGPTVGFIAGGVGTAIADLISGYAQFSWLSFLAHGLEGLVIGILARRRAFLQLVLAWLAGSAVMIAIYLLGEGLVLTGWGPALLEVPTNAGQAAVGAAVGIPLYYAVTRAYPSIRQIAQKPDWREG